MPNDAASADAIDALIQEIALQHGLGLSRDDPILVLHTINSRLLHDSSQAQKALLAQFQQEMESLALRWSVDAQGQAQQTVQRAWAMGQDAMAQALQDSAQAAAAAWRAELASGLARTTATLQDARRVAVLNVLAACIALAAAGVALWALLR